MLNLIELLVVDGRFDISLYVLLEQGELISRLPKEVHLLNRSFSDTSVLDRSGSIRLGLTVLKKAFSHGALFKRLPYMTGCLSDMLRSNSFNVEKLLWQVVSDGSDRFNETYDLAIAFLEGGATYYVANHVKASSKVAFVHVDYTQAGYTPRLDDGCVKAFRQIFAVSDEVKAAYRSVYPDAPVEVMHNQLMTEKVRALSKEACTFGDEASFHGQRLLTVGRLVPQKALEVSIEAMRLLKEKGHQDLRWYILGEGPERAKLEGLIAQYGLSDCFHLLGIRKNPYPYFRQADVYVHASRFEGKSIAIQEAQALGKPIIVSDCSGNREQVEHGKDGITCDLEPHALCEAIEYMLADADRRAAFGAQAQKRSEHLRAEVEKLLALL